jgi:site-specific recombinase XerD
MAGGEAMNASFNGPLGPFIAQHLELRRSLGFILQNSEYALHEFDRYLSSMFPEAKTVTRAMITGYLHTLSHVEAATLCDRVIHLRQFCRFLFQLNPETYIPERSLVPPGRTTRQAHIYTDEEVGSLIKTAMALPPPGSLRPHTYATLLSLLSVSGIRIGEALRLNLEDVDTDSDLLYIRQSKFFKSRLIPLARSSATGLNQYRRRRAEYGCDQRPGASFFVSERGRRCTHSTVCKTFLVLSRELGLKTIQGRDPRLHDFRHAFATRYLARIYLEGKNPGAALPLLATYLGHANITNTQVYLHPSQNLLEIAGQHFLEYTRGEHEGG